MDNERFLLILLISLIIIKLFCKDTLEGQTDQEQDDEVDTPDQATQLPSVVVAQYTLNALKERYGDVEPTRCDSKDYNGFRGVMECIALNDSRFLSCDANLNISDECMENCVAPVMARNLMDVEVSSPEHINEIKNNLDLQMTSAQETISEEKQIIQEVVSIRPSEDEGGDEVFGVDCLRNCKDYFHECEYKEEINKKGGKTSFKKTYGNIEECPNGQLPDKTCEDVEWGCKQCEDGYYVGPDNLCKAQSKSLVFYNFLFNIYSMYWINCFLVY